MGITIVRNHNKEPHSDRFNGVDYYFPAATEKGETTAVQVPDEAVEHMLGRHNPDKLAVLVRVGKANKFDKDHGFIPDPEGVKWLARFTFEDTVVVPASLAPPAPKVAPKADESLA